MSVTAAGSCDLESMVATLHGMGGSDLHLRAGEPPRVRVDGELRLLPGQPILGQGDTEALAREVLKPHVLETFERTGDADLSYTSGSGLRFRAHVYRQRGTAALVLRRVLDSPRTIEQLNLPDVVRRFAEERRGLVLVCGPAGSGKTTTLAAMIDHINRARRAHIVSVEDPVEILQRDRLASISQREVGIDVAGFAEGMRAALREDPDVIVVGEMRDRDTASAALSAAETGHLVLSSLHTTDAAETVNRVVELFPDHRQRQARLALASTLRGTICQRLVATSGGQGRVPAVEVMVNNGRVQKCILDGTAEEIPAIVADGEWYGMRTFDQSLADLIAGEVIDLREALSAASNPHDLTVTLRRDGVLAAAEPVA